MMSAYYADVQSATNLVLTIEQVLSTRAYEVDGVTVIACLTTPIYLKSERGKLKLTIQNLLNESLDGDFIVTFDTEVYRKIKDNMTNETKQSLLEKARVR